MRVPLLIVLATVLLLSACQRDAPEASASGASSSPPSEPLPFAWPPKAGQKYPDLVLKNHRGEEVRLADVARGKLVLIEPIGMSCTACNAFAGGDSRGGFNGIKPQGNLPSLERLLPDYANGLTLDNPDVLHVQLLLYNQKMGAPTVQEANAWARHFGVDGRSNHLVLVGDPRMIGPDSHKMIPGFQLLDRNFVLIKNGAGHRPPNDIYTDLLPQLGRMARR